MSIIIKGIDLPKKIKARHQHSSDCETYIELYIRSDGRVFDDELEEVGQAIQIPTPHGRLIDASKVFTYDHRAEEQLNEVPTILEEEK